MSVELSILSGDLSVFVSLSVCLFVPSFGLSVKQYAKGFNRMFKDKVIITLCSLCPYKYFV